MPVVLGPEGLTRGDVVAVARGGVEARLSDEAVAAMAATRAHVEALAASAEPAYGISTGFGGLATTSIPPEQRGPAPALAHRLARRRDGRHRSSPRSCGR